MGKIRKKKIRVIAGWTLLLILTVLSAIQVSVICSRGISMVLFVNGKEICSVNDRMTVDEALVLLNMKYNDLGIVKQMGNAVSYSYSISEENECNSAEELSEKIYEMSENILSRAYYVSVDGNDIAVCPTYSEADSVIQGLTDYIIGRIENTDGGEGHIRLITDIAIHNGFCFNSNIKSAENALDAILSRTEEKSGGNTDDTPRINAFGYSSAANGGAISGNTFDIDDLISHIRYRRVVTETVTEIIAPDVEYVKSDKVYIGNTQTLYEGENGIFENVYETEFENGKEVCRRMIGTQIISEPKNKVERIGTKHYPAAVPTGTFSWPIKKSYVITSFYSESRGKLDRGVGYHLGIDIAGSEIKIGEPVYAADGGEVIYAAKLGTYGNLIRIRHEDGVETYYAHLSKFDVSVGDKVYKGQKIGEVGMTGQSSGPHLHFEVRIDGQTADPLLYLPKKK